MTKHKNTRLSHVPEIHVCHFKRAGRHQGENLACKITVKSNYIDEGSENEYSVKIEVDNYETGTLTTTYASFDEWQTYLNAQVHANPNDRGRQVISVDGFPDVIQTSFSMTDEEVQDRIVSIFEVWKDNVFTSRTKKFLFAESDD